VCKLGIIFLIQQLSLSFTKLNIKLMRHGSHYLCLFDFLLMNYWTFFDQRYLIQIKLALALRN